MLWLNWVGAQFVPPVLVKLFVMDVLNVVIPGIYGEWAFVVQVVFFVLASVTTFSFYASSWMPAGRVTE